MLCPFCNAFRPASTEPCPQCQAPSPLVRNMGGGPLAPAMELGPTDPAPGSGWNNQAPQVSFQREEYDNTLWGQVMFPQGAPSPVQQNPPSMLPVPYQGASQQPMSQNLPAASSLIPSEESIYVPPMYTKPRAIIPRYRAISGLISVLVVFALLCAGTTYYAKATGKLSFLHQIIGDARPPNAKPTPTIMLPSPQKANQLGPASTIITSAATASTIDKQTAQPLNESTQFKVGDTIYLTYSVHPKAPGTVTVKWYTNNNFYEESKPIPVADAVSGYVPIQFSQAAEGTVELYWNGQLAMRLFFVVESTMP